MDICEECRDYKKPVISIMYIILTGLFILSIVYASFILNESSENPLKKEEYLDRYNYFKNTEILGDDLVDCDKIKDTIMVENKNLTDIFELNSNSINSNIKGLISLNVIIFFFSLFIYCYNKYCGICLGMCCGYDESESAKEGCCSAFCDYLGSICIIFIILVCLIADAIVFGILCRKFDGDDTKNYLAFLECQIINKEAFERFSVLEDLDSHFSSLKIFQSLYIVYVFIFLSFSILVKCCFLDINKKSDDKESTLIK